MKTKLKKIFEDLSLTVGSNNNKNSSVKPEPNEELTYQTTCNKTTEEVHYRQYRNKSSKYKNFRDRGRGFDSKTRNYNPQNFSGE